MLKGISPIISPDLIKILMEMGPKIERPASIHRRFCGILRI